MSAATQPGAAVQLEFAEILGNHLKQDPRVCAAWLEGSLGRGQGDRHSDIDLHLALTPEDLVGFRADYEAKLNSLHPVLKHHELFGGTMIGTLVENEQTEIIALQTWLSTDSSIQITEGRARVLFDHDQRLQVTPPNPTNPDEIRRALYVEICYFWSLFATLPALERSEVLSTVGRLHLLSNQLILVHSLGRGRARDVGDWRLNELLEAGERERLERAMALADLSPRAIVRAYLELAAIMQAAGRIACAPWKAEYPEALEPAVLRQVSRELRRMGFAVEGAALEQSLQEPSL